MNIDKIVSNPWYIRWGQGTTCKHGGFLTCSDRYNPGKFAIIVVVYVHMFYLIIIYKWIHH